MNPVSAGCVSQYAEAPRLIGERATGTFRAITKKIRVSEELMTVLRRRDGVVSIQPCCVGFPMRLGTFTNITCIQTLAGFQKILGGKSVTPDELRVIFQDNREACEALATILFDADDGEPLDITVIPVSRMEPIGKSG